MSRHQDVIATLRARGHRLTPQREMVLDIICDSPQHLTAEEIFQQIQQRTSAINLGTVYRILDLLREEHLVTVTDLGPGPVQYELALGQPHHHLVCSGCGATVSINDDELRLLQQSLATRYGWQINLEHLALFGVCPECQER